MLYEVITVVFKSEDELIVCDTLNYRVVIVSISSGKVLSEVKSPNEWKQPCSAAIDRRRSVLFVSDCLANRNNFV